MSWEKVRIGEVSSQIRGVSYTPNDVSDIQQDNYLPILRANNITEFGLYYDDLVFVNKKNVSDIQLLKKGDIVIVASSGSKHIVGKAAMFENNWKGSFGAFCKVIRPSNQVFAKYIGYYFQSETYRKKISNLSAGANINNIRNSDLDELEILLPPLLTQQKIAAILDKADELRKKDQQLLAQYDALLQSIFYDMFGDPVRNEKGWEMKTIEQIVKKGKHSIKRGPFGGALKKEIFVGNGYLVYEQFHALNNDFSFGRYFIEEKKYKELEAFDVQPGDIIISCSGIYLGKLAIVPIGAKPGIINQALLKLSLDNKLYRNEFFLEVFGHENFKQKYFPSERGVAIPNFPPMSVFKEFKFIAPPITLQNKFAAIAQNIQQQKQQVKQQIEQSENLFQSLLQRAFKGELIKE